MWLQVSGLPHHWYSTEVGWKIGKLFSQCLNVLIPENGSQSGLLIKMLVEVDLTKPLMRGTHLRFDEDSVWVEFRYEKLPTFCFYCGVVGHQEKSCGKKTLDAQKDEIREGQFGEWLRATNTGGVKKGFEAAKPQGNRAELEVKVGVRADSIKVREEIGKGAEERVLIRSENAQEFELGMQDKSDVRTLAPLPASTLEKTQLSMDTIRSQDKQNLQGSTGGDIGIMESDAMEEESGKPQDPGGMQCLQEQDQNAMHCSSSETQQQDVRGGGKWKRLSRDILVGSVPEKGSNKENVLKIGTKRGVEAHMETTVGGETFNKKVKAERSDSSVHNKQVGVASLDWPQVIQ